MLIRYLLNDVFVFVFVFVFALYIIIIIYMHYNPPQSHFINARLTSPCTNLHARSQEAPILNVSFHSMMTMMTTHKNVI